MRLDDYLPPPKQRTPAPAPTGIAFDPERPPSRRQVEASLNQPAPDCLGMTGGGACEHGTNAHLSKAAQARQGPGLKMCDTLSTSLAAMTDEQQQEKLTLAARIYEANQAAEVAYNLGVAMAYTSGTPEDENG